MDVFEAIAEPHRRAVIDLLARGEQSAGQLGEHLAGLSQPAVSRHLRILREAGLVTVRPDGQRRIYALRPERLTEVDAWLQGHRAHGNRHLDALEDHLDDLHHQPRRTRKRST